jgi:glycosyltransferase involved in cell wall biosynthesis
MGYGPMEKQINQYSEKYINIHFQEAVSPNDIIKYTSSADVGIFYSNTSWSLSYQYSLPNKFFEYLVAGLPIAFSEVFELTSNIIKEKECGWILSKNIKELKHFINSINVENIAIKQSNVNNYNKTFDWEIEAKEYLKIYKLV